MIVNLQFLTNYNDVNSAEEVNVTFHRGFYTLDNIILNFNAAFSLPANAAYLLHCIEKNSGGTGKLLFYSDVANLTFFDVEIESGDPPF